MQSVYIIGLSYHQNENRTRPPTNPVVDLVNLGIRSEHVNTMPCNSMYIQNRSQTLNFHFLLFGISTSSSSSSSSSTTTTFLFLFPSKILTSAASPFPFAAIPPPTSFSPTFFAIVPNSSITLSYSVCKPGNVASSFSILSPSSNCTSWSRFRLYTLSLTSKR